MKKMKLPKDKKEELLKRIKEIRGIAVKLDIDLVKELKILCVQEDLTITKAVELAIREFIARHQEKKTKKPT